MAKHQYVRKNPKKEEKNSVKPVVRHRGEDEDYCELFRVQGELLDRLNRKVNRYGDRLGNHEMRIREIENFFNVQYLGSDPEEDPEEAEVEAEAEEAEVEAEAEVEVVDHEEELVEAQECCDGYTGPQLVFFTHGCDGKVDYTKPFYSCLVAKGFDPNYKVVPAYVENGKYVRRLTRDEYTAYEW